MQLGKAANKVSIRDKTCRKLVKREGLFEQRMARYSLGTWYCLIIKYYAGSIVLFHQSQERTRSVLSQISSSNRRHPLTCSVVITIWQIQHVNVIWHRTLVYKYPQE